MSEAIAAEVMGKVHGRSPEGGSSFGSMYSKDQFKDQTGSAARTNTGSMRITEFYVIAKNFSQGSSQEKGDEQHSATPKDPHKIYDNKYQAYEKNDNKLNIGKKKKDPLSLKDDYQAFDKDAKDSKIYESALEQQVDAFDYESSLFRDDDKAGTSLQKGAYSSLKAMQYSALELISYAALADDHGYSSLKSDAKTSTQHYFGAAGDYGIAITEGYVGEIGLGYLQIGLTKEDGEVEQYMVMVRDKDGEQKQVKFDKHIEASLEQLLEKAKDGTIQKDDILSGIMDILGKRGNGEMNLFLQQQELAEVRKTIRKKVIKDKFDNLIVMFEKQEDKHIKKVQRLFFNKKSKKRKQEGVSYKGNQPALTYSGNGYGKAKGSYTTFIERAKNDFTNLVPDKPITMFPASGMGGVLGFTYIGEAFMGLRDDLLPEASHEVQIHEAIHTPDEYETRVITKWMLDGDTVYH